MPTCAVLRPLDGARRVRQDAACLGAPSLRIIRTFGLKAPMFTFKLCFFLAKFSREGLCVEATPKSTSILS